VRRESLEGTSDRLQNTRLGNARARPISGSGLNGAVRAAGESRITIKASQHQNFKRLIATPSLVVVRNSASACQRFSSRTRSIWPMVRVTPRGAGRPPTTTAVLEKPQRSSSAAPDSPSLRGSLRPPLGNQQGRSPGHHGDSVPTRPGLAGPLRCNPVLNTRRRTAGRCDARHGLGVSMPRTAFDILPPAMH